MSQVPVYRVELVKFEPDDHRMPTLEIENPHSIYWGNAWQDNHHPITGLLLMAQRIAKSSTDAMLLIPIGTQGCLTVQRGGDQPRMHVFPHVMLEYRPRDGYMEVSGYPLLAFVFDRPVELESLECCAKSQPRATDTGWQPIETAPKDGTRVDLWVVQLREQPHRVPNCAWETGKFGACWRDSLGRIAEYTQVLHATNRPPDMISWSVHDEIRATHWRPIPGPPPP